MALYPNTGNPWNYNGTVGKTHTNLVISEGNAPAERFIVSKTNTFESFIYEFGPEGNQTVLIPKGKIVEAVGIEKDRHTNHKHTAVRVAQENSEKVLGVNHHNVYEQRRDRMEGNLPTIITRNVIEVPLFEATSKAVAAETAKAIKFGAAYGTTNELQPGDYVVAGVDGNFKKYDAAINKVTQIVGQVVGADRELPPAGFLQYFMEMNNPEMEAFIKAISHAPTPGKEYPYGQPYTVKGWKPEFEKQLMKENNKGIPFLTDGFFRAQKRIDVTLEAADVNLENAIVSGEELAIAGGDVTVKAGQEGAVFIKLKHKLNPRKMDNLVVQYKDGADAVKVVNKKDVHIDVQNNTVVVYLEADATDVVFKDLTVKADAIVNPVAGIPTEWDHEGSVGAVRILLQK